jgi:ATP-binding cassette subfamily C protein
MTPISLIDFFKITGLPCVARAGTPLWLHGSNVAWLVNVGKIDVFLTKSHNNQPNSALHPLFRVEAGQLLFGLGDRMTDEGWGMVAIGGPDTRLLQLDRSQLQTLTSQKPETSSQLAELLDTWVELLASPLSEASPENLRLLEDNVEYPVKLGDVFITRQHTLWLAPAVGEFSFRARTPIHPDAGFFPLPRLSWLNAGCDGSLQAVSCEEFLRLDENWSGLDAFHDALLNDLIAQVESAEEQKQQRLARKTSNEQQNIRNAMLQLSAILDNDAAPPVSETSKDNPLLAACQLVGSASGIVFTSPLLAAGDDDSKRDLLREIIEASRVRHRAVVLKGKWWNKDNGNLLAYLEEDNQPVALLLTSTGYSLSNPVTGSTHAVTADIAASLKPFATTFYRSFGASLITLKEMLKFGSYGMTRDFLMIIGMGVVIGLLGMVTPMATGMLFDTVIPGADRSQLAQLTLALLAGAFATAMFEVTRGFALLRAEGKMDSAIQSAVWDRLLLLPAPFFRDYSAGDLSMRAMGINSIRQALSGNALHALFSLVFSVFNLVLLFSYNAKLALVGIALVLIAMLITIALNYLRLGHERKLAAVQGRLSGLVFQYLGSVTKLRTTGAESRAFFNWATLFAQLRNHEFKAGMVGNAQAVFNSVFSTIVSMTIFFCVFFFLKEDKSFSTGTFMAFNSALGGFMGAMMGAISVASSLLNLVPIYERAKPILHTPPEVNDSKANPGQLNGEIEINNLSFSYHVDGPLILSEISLQIKPGEFVALVGSSGSGKSTLLRLLLGFETATSGSIYYSQQDIASIDLGALRRQLGVVLQNGQLMSGDIFSNIVGAAAKLTLEDAWEAATQAGIADDIRDMPMGMHTVVSDGGGTLSGGQRQRLLIARAIVNRPRILFFDEATSALDNRTQQMVSTSLENLCATRIIIAHRLSTIINADRIFVLDGGKLVQTGTYEELINVNGLFAELAKRQIV